MLPNPDLGLRILLSIQMSSDVKLPHSDVQPRGAAQALYCLFSTTCAYVQEVWSDLMQIRKDCQIFSCSDWYVQSRGGAQGGAQALSSWFQYNLSRCTTDETRSDHLRSDQFVRFSHFLIDLHKPGLVRRRCTPGPVRPVRCICGAEQACLPANREEPRCSKAGPVARHKLLISWSVCISVIFTETTPFLHQQCNSLDLFAF